MALGTFATRTFAAVTFGALTLHGVDHVVVVVPPSIEPELIADSELFGFPRFDRGHLPTPQVLRLRAEPPVSAEDPTAQGQYRTTTPGLLQVRALAGPEVAVLPAPLPLVRNRAAPMMTRLKAAQAPLKSPDAAQLAAQPAQAPIFVSKAVPAAKIADPGIEAAARPAPAPRISGAKKKEQKEG